MHFDYKDLPQYMFAKCDEKHSLFKHSRWQNQYCEKDIRWWHDARNKWLLTHKMRDELTQENFYQTFAKFMHMNEGCVLKPYLDSRNCWHIGYGLLLKKKHSNNYEKLAVDAFAFINKDIYALSDPNFFITQAQAQDLLKYVASYNEKILKKKIYGYEKLSLNKQLALQSLFYHAPALIGKNLQNYIKRYLQTNDLQFIISCIYEIEQNSNQKTADWKGIQNRRYKEGAMFSNKRIDLCIRLCDEFFVKYLNGSFSSMQELRERMLDQTMEIHSFPILYCLLKKKNK